MTADQAQAILAKIEAVQVKIDAVQEDVREIKERDLPEIKAQGKETNGRVNTLEAWRDRIAGGLTLLVLLVTVFGVYVVERV